jgi:hypothetical protein
MAYTNISELLLSLVSGNRNYTKMIWSSLNLKKFFRKGQKKPIQVSAGCFEHL